MMSGDKIMKRIETTDSGLNKKPRQSSRGR